MTATKCENLLQVGETLLFKADTEVTRLPMQLTWLHVCVAVSCDKNQISAVVNGVKVLGTQGHETLLNQPVSTFNRTLHSQYLNTIRYYVGT